MASSPVFILARCSHSELRREGYVRKNEVCVSKQGPLLVQYLHNVLPLRRSVPSQSVRVCSRWRHVCWDFLQEQLTKGGKA